jgi:hypothetical protein
VQRGNLSIEINLLLLAEELRGVQLLGELRVILQGDEIQHSRFPLLGQTCVSFFTCSDSVPSLSSSF